MASNATNPSTSVFMASCPCWLLPTSLQLLSWTDLQLLNHYLNSTPVTPRLAAISHQPPTLLTAISRLSHNHSSSLLYSLGKDCTENTSPNSSSTVASCNYHTDCIENTPSQLLHCCSHYLPMAVAELLTSQSSPSNECTRYSIKNQCMRPLYQKPLMNCDLGLLYLLLQLTLTSSLTCGRYCCAYGSWTTLHKEIIQKGNASGKCTGKYMFLTNTTLFHVIATFISDIVKKFALTP
jgi:hypothetical protein